jgi:SAM-dependent methyltransferase
VTGASAESRTVAGVPEGLPADYYERIYAVEQTHWWHDGMRRISAALLGERLRRPGLHLLDAGCGTGGFLRWALAAATLDRACGADLAPGAIELARIRVPEADLHIAPLKEMPYEAASFDLVVTNDVLQHVPESDVSSSLVELRRMLRPDGALLVRTNGARRWRRERNDWRVYDRGTLGAALAAAGFRCERLTHANLLLSALATLQGRSPRAPDSSRHGIPAPVPRPQAALASLTLRAEARLLRLPRTRLPYGHTLLALAVPA